MHGSEHELRASALACRRGGRELFHGIGFTLRPGQWLHVRGANGAGKTSLLRILAGLSAAHAGHLEWCGVELRRAKDDYRDALAWLGHRSGLKEELSALDNLRLAAALDGRALGEDRARQALARVGLRGRECLPLRALSQGQRRRALMARVLARGARLWILDEPLAALDSHGIDMVGGLLEDHLDAGGSVVLSSHQSIGLSGGLNVDL
jgi:heme exporter protein A